MPIFRVYFDRRTQNYLDVDAANSHEAVDLVQHQLDTMDEWERARVGAHDVYFQASEAELLPEPDDLMEEPHGDDPEPAWMHGDYEDYSRPAGYPDSFTSESDEQTADPDQNPYLHGDYEDYR